MRLKRYIGEMTHKMNYKMSRMIGNDLMKLLKDDYLKKIPVQQIIKILDKHGLVPLKDNTVWKGKLSNSKSDTVTFDLGVKALKDGNTYPVIPDAGLIITYNKVDSEKYEVTVNIG